MSVDPNWAQWPYWSLDVPGLTHAAALKIGTAARQMGVIDDFDLVDPSDACTIHLDKESVLALVHAMRAGEARVREEERFVIDGLLAWFTEWLEYIQKSRSTE